MYFGKTFKQNKVEIFTEGIFRAFNTPKDTVSSRKIRTGRVK